MLPACTVLMVVVGNVYDNDDDGDDDDATAGFVFKIKSHTFKEQ